MLFGIWPGRVEIDLLVVALVIVEDDLEDPGIIGRPNGSVAAHVARSRLGSRFPYLMRFKYRLAVHTRLRSLDCPQSTFSSFSPTYL